MTRTHKIAIVAATVVAVGGTGAAVAAAKRGSPEQERRAVLNDAARRLGVAPERLSEALEEAMKARIDAAVEDGRLSKDEGERLKRAIERRGVPMLTPGLGRDREFTFRHFHPLADAGEYLGMKTDDLRRELRRGKTLAEIARERDKSVDGLVDALLAEPRKRIEQAVEDGRLTRAEADDLLAGLRARTLDRVHGRIPSLPRLRRDRPPLPDGPPRFFRDPPEPPAAF